MSKCGCSADTDKLMSLLYGLEVGNGDPTRVLGVLPVRSSPDDPLRGETWAEAVAKLDAAGSRSFWVDSPAAVAD